MSSPLFDAIGNATMSGPMGQMQQMIQSYKEFKANFHGDARSEVQKLLNSGRISQQDYNQLQQMATQLSMMLNK